MNLATAEISGTGSSPRWVPVLSDGLLSQLHGYSAPNPKEFLIFFWGDRWTVQMMLKSIQLVLQLCVATSNQGLGLDSKMDEVRTFEGQRFSGELPSGSTGCEKWNGCKASK